MDPESDISKSFISIAEKLIDRDVKFDPSLKPMFLKGGPGGK